MKVLTTTDMKKSLIFATLTIFILACSQNRSQQTTEEVPVEDQKSLIGYVDLSDPLEEDLIATGKKIFTEKCARCHTQDTARFLVPSFAGITNRRTPEWIMNMIINVDVMVEIDSIAHGLLMETGIKMPEPQLTIEEARSVLEFFRRNDMEQVGSKDEGVSLRESTD